MKKLFLIISIMGFIQLNLYPQDKKCLCNTCNFVDIDYKGNIFIFDTPNGKIVKKMRHNIDSGDFIMLSIKQSSERMFYVSAYYSMNEESVIAEGWINKSDKLRIYSSTYSTLFTLYSTPDKQGEIIFSLKGYDPDMLIVLDCKDKWLKVKTIYKGKVYVGWIPPEMQCCNVYSTCS